MIKQKPKIDKQLDFFVKSLEKNKVNYLIDSGTLLGIIRDGKLMKWDTDIDITSFEGEEERIKKVITDAKKEGYNVGEVRYKKYLFGIDFTTDYIKKSLFYPYIPQKKINGNRKVSITILKKKEDIYWEPALFSQGEEKEGIQYYISKFKRGIFVVLSRFFPNNKVIKKIVSKGHKKRYKYGTHIIPIKYFYKRKKYMGLTIPADSSNYLKYRYGGWKKPVKNWSYMRDDDSFKFESPEELGLI
jgi:hypothetical protein